MAASVALPGQGRALPQDFPFRGQWLAQPRFFLFEPETASVVTTAGDIAAKAVVPEGGIAVGFDAVQVAGCLEMTAAGLFDENRAGRLSLKLGPGIAAPGAVSALRCTLQAGGRLVAVTVQRFDDV